jgi:hypothetical protein
LWLKSGENIFWVSWCQLSEILETESLAGYPDYSQGEINLLEDIRSNLRWEQLLRQQNTQEFINFVKS